MQEIPQFLDEKLQSQYGEELTKKNSKWIFKAKICNFKSKYNKNRGK